MRREFELACPDGVRLYARAFEAENPRAVLCIAHGLGEHGDRYQHFAEVMNRSGITVYVHDHRGHGRNVTKNSQRGIARIHSGLVFFHSGLELRAEHFVLQGLDLRHFHALFGTLDVRQIGLLLFVIFGLHDGA